MKKHALAQEAVIDESVGASVHRKGDRALTAKNVPAMLLIENAIQTFVESAALKK